MSAPVGSVIVTGAAGELGMAIAESFARQGRSLALFERNDELLSGASERLLALGAAAVLPLAADQIEVEAVERAASRVNDELGAPDILIANAGFARIGSFLDMSDKNWQRHIDINLNGTFNVCRSVARRMVESKAGGSIVVVSSNLALNHADQNSAYSTSKAALLTLMRSMAAELGIYGIRVNAILPGVIDTRMTRTVLNEAGSELRLVSRTPVGRLGTTADVAAAIDFLSGPSAGFITGASLLVDGGQSLYGEPKWVTQERVAPHEPRWVSTATGVELP